MALIAVAIAMAIMIAIPAGLNANQAAAVSARNNIQASLDFMNNEIQNMSLVVEASYGSAGRGDQVIAIHQVKIMRYLGYHPLIVIHYHGHIEHQFAGGRSEHSRIRAKDRRHAEHEQLQAREFHSRQFLTRNPINLAASTAVWGIPTNRTIRRLTPTIVSGRAISPNETGSP